MDLVNDLKGPSFRLVHWLNNISCPRKISQESINVERKYSQESSPVVCCTRRGNWKGDILAVDFEELDEMDASEFHVEKIQRKRGDIAQKL